MNTQDHATHKAQPAGSFWRSRSGIVLITFLVVGGLLLAYEHRIHLLTGNGFVVALLALSVGMHLFMHRGHGGRKDESHHGDLQ